MKVLELYSGTGSVGKVCKERGFDVVSVDIDGRADINIDILKWDYKKAFKVGEFDIIWASPPCHTFSNLRRSWINRKLKVFGDNVVTAEMLDADMIANGLPLLRKAEEIINYFKPKYFFIENPASSKMKDYLKHLDNYEVDYCQYSEWGYKKPTIIWCNKNLYFEPKKCDKKTCPHMIHTDKFSRHKNNLGNTRGNKLTGGSVGVIDTRYRIPPKLINELFDSCN